MSRAAILGLLASLIVGCTGEVWRVDSRFTPEERAGIEQAADTWQAVGQQVWVSQGHRVNGYETGGKYIVRETVRTAHMIDPEMNPKAEAKYNQWPGRELIIVVPEVASYTPFWQVMAHEMGHSLGLDHVADPRAIMYYTGSHESLGCLTSTDIEEMCRVQGCEGVPRGCDE